MYNPPRRTVNNALRSRRRVSSARHGVALGRPVRWASSMQASVIARAGAGAYLCVVLGGNAVPSVAKSASLPWLGEKKPEVELMGLSFFFAPTVPGRQLCGLCCRVEEVAQRQAHQRSAAKWLRVVKMTSCCVCVLTSSCVYTQRSRKRACAFDQPRSAQGRAPESPPRSARGPSRVCERGPPDALPSQKARVFGCAKHPGATYATPPPQLRVRMTCAAKLRPMKLCAPVCVRQLARVPPGFVRTQWQGGSLQVLRKRAPKSSKVLASSPVRPAPRCLNQSPLLPTVPAGLPRVAARSGPRAAAAGQGKKKGVNLQGASSNGSFCRKEPCKGVQKEPSISRILFCGWPPC